MNNSGWTPIKNGEEYCSPLCGGKCTYSAYLRAIENGDKLASQAGKGYTRVVRENVGWHFSAIDSSGHMKVYRDGNRNYSALFGGLGPGGIYTGRGSTAKSAIIDAINKAKKHRDTIDKYLVAVGGK